MQPDLDSLEQMDSEQLPHFIIDALRRIVFHYGQWFAQAEHQFGMEKALEIEAAVWQASFGNQVTRLGKTLGFSVEKGLPACLQSLDRETAVNLIKSLAINWLANDGIWFQAVENQLGMNDAKRCNDTCWSRYSPYEAARIKQLLDLPADGGLTALKKALAFRMYALINEQSIETVDEHSFVFYMNNCRVQAARQRKGLPDYPCKSAGLVEYPTFAAAIDPRIRTECVGCPPDEHPEEWFCAWKFTLVEA
jgi:hypothetical protein